MPYGLCPVFTSQGTIVTTLTGTYASTSSPTNVSARSLEIPSGFSLFMDTGTTISVQSTLALPMTTIASPTGTAKLAWISDVSGVAYYFPVYPTHI
jgi:hypothetical protein